MVSNISLGYEIEEGDVTFASDARKYRFTERQDKDVLIFFCILMEKIEETVSPDATILYNNAQGYWSCFEKKQTVRYYNISRDAYLCMNGYITGTQKYCASIQKGTDLNSFPRGINEEFNTIFLAGRTYHYVIIYDNN